MPKFLILFLFLISFAARIQASEMAFDILLKHGFNENELSQFIKKYPELKTLQLASGINYNVPENHDESYFEVRLYTAKSNEAYAASKFGNVIDIEKLNVEFLVEVKTFKGIVRNTLYDSVMKDIDSPKAATQLSEAFQDEFVNTKGLRTTAIYQYQIEQYFDDGQFIRFGNVLSASLIIGKARIKKIYKINPETFSWMLMPEKLFNLKEKIFYLPVESTRITSGFQLNRRHPVTKRHRPHNGIDFGAPNGLPVYPALDGVVIAAARTRSKGKYITILHDNGHETSYCHLKSFAPGIKTGRRVELDEKIGEVGRTGLATGAHLHFTILENGYYINPINLLKSYTYNQRNEQVEIDSGLDDQNIIEEEVFEEPIED